MTRILVALLVMGLVLAPGAVAKGPHATLTSGPEAVKAGVPWEATIQLNEFGDTPNPSLIAIRADGHVDAKIGKAASRAYGAVAFKTTMVFPYEGRWKLMLIAGKRRFNFPALDVGGRAPHDYVSFPVGSAAARMGAGGEYTRPEPADTSGDNGVLPPEVLNIAEDAEPADDGGVAMWWLFPAVGVVLAGAGIALRTRH